MTPKSPWFFLFFALTFFLVVGAVQAIDETREFSVTDYEIAAYYQPGYTGAFHSNGAPSTVRFADISYYENDPPSSMYFTFDDSVIYTYPSESHTEYNVTIATGARTFNADMTIAPLLSINKTTLSLTNIHSFDTGGFTGDVYLTLPPAFDYKGFVMKNHYTPYANYTDGSVLISRGSYGPDIQTVSVYNSVSWKNIYSLSGETPPYTINVMRENMTDYRTDSKWTIWDGGNLILEDINFSTSNFTANVYSYNTMIEVDDYYSLGQNYVYYPLFYESWEDQILWSDAPITYFLSGYVYSSAGGLLHDVAINVDDLGSDNEYQDTSDMGYYNVTLVNFGIFETTASKTGFLDSVENVTILPDELLTQYDIVLFENVTGSLDAGKSGIQGLIRDYNTGSLISSARVEIAGEVTYTNSVGYYNILNVDPANYTITASHADYNSVSNVINLTADTVTTFDINLIPLEGVTDEDEDEDDGESPEDRTVKAIYDLFGLIGLPAGWVNSIVALVLIICAVIAVSLVSKDSTVMIIAAFIVFVVTIALGLLPQSFLAIVIIVIIAGILHLRGTF